MDESVEQLDPTTELTTEVIKTRVISGVAVLTGMMFFSQAVSFFAGVLLAIFLTPTEFGVYYLMLSVQSVLTLFGDVGFAPALIQKKERLTDVELRTVFTAQQILILLLFLIVVFIVSPLLGRIYHFNQNAIYLLWALSFFLFINSLKTVPSSILERKLAFKKLVIPGIAENIVFNLIVVFLAWKGFGITSYTFAFLVSGVVGLSAIYIIQPWMPRIAFSAAAFKSILRYGIPYQINTVLAKVKDDLLVFILGLIIGLPGVGLLFWAKRWAEAPLRFFMDQVIRATFPAFSRLQDNRKDLSGLVTKSIFFICLLIFPSLVMLVLLAPSLVYIVPKYVKWIPALFALSVLTINSSLAAITTPLTNTLNAIGKIATTFKLMIMWTVLTWIFVPVLAYLFGINGAAVGFVLTGFGSFVAWYIVSKYVDIDYLQSVGKPLLAAVLTGGVVFVVKSLLPVSVQQVAAMIVTGLVSYLIVIFILEPKLPLLIKNQFKKG